MSILRGFSISRRLQVLLCLMVLGLIAVVTVSLITTNSVLRNGKQEENRFLVEAAFSVLEHYHEKSQKGELSEQEAKQRASQVIADMRFDGDNYFWIQDRNPNIIMHATKPSLNGQSVANTQDPNGKKLFVEMAKVVEKEGEGFVSYMWPLPGKDKPVEKISFVKGFEPWGWIVGSGLYLDKMESDFWAVATKILSIVGVLSIALIALIMVISRSISEPLRLTTGRMAEIADGEGDLTRKLPVEGKDEIAMLSTHFNNFLTNIATILSDVKHSSGNVIETSKSLEMISEQGYQRSQLQNERSTDVAAAVEEMTVNIKGVSRSANEVEESALKAQKNAVEGNSVVNTTVHDISELALEIEKISNAITELAQDTQAIGSVLDVIRGIAEQTNLLALNAAIEAARAGEQGRGFAVVADEVRTLASRTGQSTEEIQRMIEQLQSRAQNAVNAVSSSNEKFNLTREKASEAGTALAAVDDIMNSLLSVVTQIAHATEQQSQAAEEINRRVAELSELSGETLTSNEGLRESSKTLNHESSAMLERISSFKTE